jgi:glutamyl-tRNA synthetase
MDDLDLTRSRPEYEVAALEDLAWFGLAWSEGPDIGGLFGPYRQSERIALYRDAFERLKAVSAVYPCYCSRKDIASALVAPHALDDEPVYPGTCRTASEFPPVARRTCWRFRVPDGQRISFLDGAVGEFSLTAGRDFGDFVVWRQDDLPSYQLACAVDDALMQITEVVRGADLLVSTARQILVYQALGYPTPSFYHCPLVTDEQGVRLAKRTRGLSLRELRAQGTTPKSIRQRPDFLR